MKKSTAGKMEKKKREESRVKRAMKALALAGIERLGKESAANQAATNTFLLHDIADLLMEPMIFVCGGDTGTERIKSVDIFDVEKKEWSRGPDMPEPRQEHGLAIVGNRIFAIGGGEMTVGMTNIVTAFDVGRRVWKEMPPMSTKRARPGVGVVDDKIFVFGGRDTRHHFLSSCEVFSVTEDKWMMTTTVAPMPTERYDMGVVVVGHRIFAIGGYNGRALTTVEVLDTKANSWATLPPLSFARQGVAAAVIEDRFIWCLGGYDEDDFGDIEVFDIEKNMWSIQQIKLTSARYGAKTVVIEGKIWLIGGCLDVDRKRIVEVFDPKTLDFETAPSLLTPRQWHDAVLF